MYSSLSFAELMDAHPLPAHLLFAKPIEYLHLFDEAAIKAQVLQLSTNSVSMYCIYDVCIHIRLIPQATNCSWIDLFQSFDVHENLGRNM